MKIQRLISVFLLSLALVAMGACGSTGKSKDLDDTVILYGQLIRWNEFEEAIKYRDSEYAKENPVSDSYREFLKNITVTGYTEKQKGIEPDGVSAFQVVEVRYYNVQTARERVITNRQSWRYDEESKRWLLYGDLPDFAAKK
jgi:hypothetical protein